MIAGDRTQRNVKKSSIPERTPSCHSRESGNPWGMCLCAERLNFKVSFLAAAKWIPAFAGMTSGGGCRSRPRLKHSRAGYSGNPWGTSQRVELANRTDGYPANAQWIPAFAGMRGWPRATRRMGRVTLSADKPAKAVVQFQPLSMGLWPEASG